ncbi:MAG: hypothetical protein P8129_25680 [Anaerolineae bacterium]
MRTSSAQYRQSSTAIACAILAVCINILSVSCASPTPSAPVSVDTFSIRDLYPEAMQLARTWKQDAYLVWANTTFWPTDGDEFRRASSTDVIGLLVGYDPATGSFEDEWVSVAKESPQQKIEIEDTDWRLDSTEALEIAQRAGGAEFLAGRIDGDLQLYIRLEKRQVSGSMRTVWFAGYYVGMPASDSLRVVIDAVTGQVLEVDGVPR